MSTHRGGAKFKSDAFDFQIRGLRPMGTIPTCIDWALRFHLSRNCRDLCVWRVGGVFWRSACVRQCPGGPHYFGNLETTFNAGSKWTIKSSWEASRERLASSSCLFAPEISAFLRDISGRLYCRQIFAPRWLMELLKTLWLLVCADVLSGNQKRLFSLGLGSAVLFAIQLNVYVLRRPQLNCKL
jgi:hypothetical protein